MIKQYPHLMVFTQPGSTVEQDAAGHDVVVPGADTLPIQQECRAEAAGSGREGNVIKSTDGQNLYFGWIVYTPASFRGLPFGTSVTVYQDGDKVRATGTVKQCDASDFHTRIWL